MQLDVSISMLWSSSGDAGLCEMLLLMLTAGGLDAGGSVRWSVQAGNWYGGTGIPGVGESVIVSKMYSIWLCSFWYHKISQPTYESSNVLPCAAVQILGIHSTPWNLGKNRDSFLKGTISSRQYQYHFQSLGFSKTSTPTRCHVDRDNIVPLSPRLKFVQNWQRIRHNYF